MADEKKSVEGSTKAVAAGAPQSQPLHGTALTIGTIALSLATFMNVLDTSIANVSIPAISGDLGVSPDQGTWVITSFGVANAISLPLTGWLTRTFGQVKLFIWSVTLFTIASFLCALAPSLNMLILFRVLQGAVAGPMMPLSQALLLSSYPKAKAGAALGMWSITTLVAPVVGPVLGGWITDNISWPWIFYINIPVGIIAGVATWFIYKSRETPTMSLPIDKVGLFLLVLWVGALQVMLDKGKDLDWFGSGQIITLAIVAVVGFTIFLIWELTEEHPIVDLSLFGRRNFLISTISMLMAYGLFFGNVVLLPLWLQQYMGYTATLAGLVLAPVGLFAIFLTPIVGRFMGRVDPRIFVTVAFSVFAVVLFMRQHFNTDATIGTLLVPTLIQGVAMAFFFIPLISISLVWTAARAHPQRFRPVQFCSYHRGIIRHIDHHHPVGPPSNAAPLAVGRAHDRLRPCLRTSAGDSSVRGSRRPAELRCVESPGRPTSLHAFRRRHLLRLRHPVPGADLRDLAR